MFETIIQLLRSDGSIIINKRLIKGVGLYGAIVYSELLSRFYYFESRGKTIDGWFFNTVEDLESGTGLSGYQQRKAIKSLEEHGLIEVEQRGMPKTRHFKINQNVEKLIEILGNKSSSDEKTKPSSGKDSGEETARLVVKKLNTNNTQYNNTNNTNIDKSILVNKNQEISSSLITKKDDLGKKRNKKGKDIETMKKMINVFSDDITVKNKLNMYFSHRVKKGLKPEQWEIMLERLKQYAGKDKIKMIRKIDSAISGGYMQIVFDNDLEEKTYKKANFDNTVNHKNESIRELSRKEMDKYRKNLAKDNDGNFAKF